MHTPVFVSDSALRTKTPTIVDSVITVRFDHLCSVHEEGGRTADGLGFERGNLKFWLAIRRSARGLKRVAARSVCSPATLVSSILARKTWKFIHPNILHATSCCLFLALSCAFLHSRPTRSARDCGEMHGRNTNYCIIWCFDCVRSYTITLTDEPSPRR